MSDGYDFDVAVSFAGPDRRFVHDVVQRLKSAGVTVFYDEDHTARLWGENLVDLLHSIYSRRARYAMLFVSRHYLRSAWATHERHSAQERALHQSGAYLLPIRLDDTDLPGLPTTVGYLDARQHDANAIADLMISKLSPTAVGAQHAARVPDSLDDVAALLAERPPRWEYSLFAAVLRRGCADLAPKHRDHVLRYAIRAPESLDDDQALRLIHDSGVRFEAIIAAFHRMLTTDAQRATFGGPGEPADPDLIIHLGQRVVAVYEELLDWSAALRAATIGHPALRRLADVTARFADQPIASLRLSVTGFVHQVEAMPERLPAGEPIAIDIVLRLTVPDELMAEHATALAAYEAGIAWPPGDGA